ncbi:MAG: acyl-CoA dehydrogenase family protein, partial [Candidatus Binatia bacterium]
MDFGFSEEQDMLRQGVREFLAGECPMTYVRRMMDDERGFTDEQWTKMAELGWTGLIIPEEYGGAGLSMVDMVVVLEEMGQVVFPGPFFASAILGGVAIDLGGSADQKKRWLPQLAAGTARATLAHVEESGRWDAAGVQMRAAAAGGGFALSGTKLFVHDAHNADVLVVAARTGGAGADGVTLFLVEAGAPGVRTRVLKTLDQTRKLCEVVFEDVRVAAAAALGAVGQGWGLLDRVVDRAKVALSAELCGIAQQVLDLSVQYAKVREQFGRAIGTFQAIQHKCANMLVQVESAKSATYYAAWAVANDAPEAHLAACMAKAYTSEACRQVAADGIQIHGGIGFTWEHDMHLFFKRAKSSEIAFGDATHNRELVAQVLLDQPEKNFSSL